MDNNENNDYFNRGRADAIQREASSMIALNDIQLYGKICKDDEERERINNERKRQASQK